MIQFPIKNCVGCTACVSACQSTAIKMQRDAEGFQTPYLSNANACTDCNLCRKVCPVLNLKSEVKNEEQGYIAQIKDKKIRLESASGGMFSAIAITVLKNGGVVYGAAYNEKFEVIHISVETQEELWRLRNSKYVQSNLSGVFNRIKKQLVAGRLVCFSGTPCQIEGLKAFLQKEYDNLLLVDVVCHGVSSPLIWEKYLQMIRKFAPTKLYFRWKHYGYKYSTMSAFNADGKEVYFSGVESDKMLRAYFTNNCDRESCYNCLFKKRYRVSDFTIWDCFQPKYFCKEFDDDCGTSCVLVNSQKGKYYFEQISKSGLLNYLAVDPDDLTFGNREMVCSVKRGPYRNEILQDAAKMDAGPLFEKYFPTTMVSKAKKTIRLLLVKTGLYQFFKYRIYLYRRSKENKRG